MAPVNTQALGFHLVPLTDRILQEIRAGERAFADKTPQPTLSPSRPPAGQPL